MIAAIKGLLDALERIGYESKYEPPGTHCGTCLSVIDICIRSGNRTGDDCSGAIARAALEAWAKREPLVDVLLAAGQACVDWSEDHGQSDCHLCQPSGRAGVWKHDEECPLSASESASAGRCRPGKEPPESESLGDAPGKERP